MCLAHEKHRHVRGKGTSHSSACVVRQSTCVHQCRSSVSCLLLPYVLLYSSRTAAAAGERAASSTADRQMVFWWRDAELCGTTFYGCTNMYAYVRRLLPTATVATLLCLTYTAGRRASYPLCSIFCLSHSAQQQQEQGMVEEILPHNNAKYDYGTRQKKRKRLSVRHGTRKSPAGN